MVLSFDEMKEIEEIKQKQKIEIIKLTDENDEKKHQRVMKELQLQLDIAKVQNTKIQ